MKKTTNFFIKKLGGRTEKEFNDIQNHLYEEIDRYNDFR